MKTWASVYNRIAEMPRALRGKPRPKAKFAGAKKRNWAYKPQPAYPCIVIPV